MAKDLTGKQRKDYAYTSFINEDLTQAELAEKVGVSKVTINKWIKDGKWQEMKNMLSITTDELLKNYTSQLAELNKDIQGRAEGKRFPNSKEADLQIKLSKAIEIFKGKADLSDLIIFNKKFIQFLRKNHPDKVKETTLLLNEFVQDNL